MVKISMTTAMLETYTGVETMVMMKEYQMTVLEDLPGEYIQVEELLTTTNSTDQTETALQHLMEQV